MILLRLSRASLLGGLTSVALASTAMGQRFKTDDPVTRRELQAHLGFLADDQLEGRGAGTRGHELAARYVAAHFKRIGLEPAGDDGTFLQGVRMRSAVSHLAASRLVVHATDGDRALTAVNDMVVRPSIAQASVEIRAPAVFVGFGVHAPRFGYDDFAENADVRGKIAVVLAGSPSNLPATARAHYSRIRAEELERRGAIGMVTVYTPKEVQRTPWAVALNSARFPRMRLVDHDGSVLDDHPGLRALASVSLAAAEALFRNAPRKAADVFAASERGEPQAFALGVELTLAARAEPGEARSPNVVGLLPGSDPAFAGAPLVVTTHLDHLGIGPAIDGDAIYNGAYDNGIGCAVLLRLAEQLAGADGRARRPILFAAVTGEEKGLLGSYHLSLHPPAGISHYAANVNVDMALFLAPVRDVIARGDVHSSLGAIVNAVARELKFTVSPDPMPDEVVFVRSDQFSFVRRGVPALYLVPGTRPLDASVDLPALEKAFRRNRYHRPSDDLSQEIDWPSAVAFTSLVERLVYTIADEKTAPAWLPGDFFGEMFGKK